MSKRSDDQSAEISKRLSNLEDLVKGTLTTITLHFGKLSQSVSELVESNKNISSDIKTLINLNNTLLSEVTTTQDEIQQDPEMFSVELLESSDDELDGSHEYFEAVETSTTGTSSKPEIKCDVCGKVFVVGSLTNSISKHQMTTSCKKPFKCPCCDKFFTKAAYRDSHVNSHFK